MSIVSKIEGYQVRINGRAIYWTMSLKSAARYVNARAEGINHNEAITLAEYTTEE